MSEMMSPGMRKLLLPTLGVLGANAGVHALVTGSLKGSPSPSFDVKDGIALGAEVVVSAAAGTVWGATVAAVGIGEAIVLAGIKLLFGTPAPARPNIPLVNPAPKGGSSLTSKIDTYGGLVKTAQPLITAAAKYIGLAAVDNSLAGAALGGQPDYMEVLYRNWDNYDPPHRAQFP